MLVVLVLAEPSLDICRSRVLEDTGIAMLD